MKEQILKLFALGLLIILFWFFFYTPRDQTPSDGKIHVQYWYATGQKDIIPYPVTLFNKIQNNIYVDAVAIPWQESEKKILTAILSGEPPQIINQFAPVTKLASRMALTPLDAFIQEDQFDSTVIFSSLWKEMKWQDHVFAIPIWTASYALFYNKRLFREAGLDPERPPETWEEVKYYSDRLLKRDIKNNIRQMGYLFYLGKTLKASQQAEDTPLLMAWQKGVPFLNVSGDKIEFANKDMASITEWIIDVESHVSRRDLDAFTAGFGYGDQHAFISEKCAMMILGSTFPESIERYKSNLEYGVARIPSFEGGPTSSSTGSFWMAIPRGAKNKNAAWEFIKFFISDSVQVETIQHMQENLYPANKLAAAHPLFLKSPTDSIFYDQLKFAHSSTIVPLAHDVFWREYYNALEKAIYKIEKPLKALEQAQRIVQSELDEAIEYDRFVRSQMKFEDLYW